MNLFFRLLLAQLFFILGLNQATGQILSYDTSVEVKSGKLYTETSVLIQINDKESEWLSDVEIPYQEGSGFDLQEAVILNSRGEILRKLRKKEITTRSYISQGSFYEDSYIKEFKLKWHLYPYRIKYTYRTAVKEFIYVARWEPLLYTNVPTLNASLHVELPADYEVRMKYSDELEYKADTTGRTHLHNWKAGFTDKIDEVGFAPPYREMLPSVTIVPQYFEYEEEGSFASWASYGAWQARMNEGSEVLPHYERTKVDQLLAGVEDPKEKVRLLYHYMQDNTRYIYVGIDVGGLKPYPASYVSEKKYGDCKALTVYMKALLNYVGIPSYYTKIYAGDNPVRIDKTFPSQQFNHVILCVPMNGDTLWLENTANYFPFNYLGTFTQNRYGLLVNGENSRLVKTPALNLLQNKEKRVFHFILNKKGKGSVLVKENLKGEAFEHYRYVNYSFSENDQEKFIRNKLPLNDFSIAEWKFERLERDAQCLELKASALVRNQFRTLGNMIALKPQMTFRLEMEESKKVPVRINYPVFKSDSVVYELPFISGLDVQLPENVDIATTYGSFKETYSRQAAKVILKREFILHTGDYKTEEYPEFYSFITSVNNYQNESTIIIHL